MDRYDYRNLCDDLASGNRHQVRNTKTGVTGEILMCSHEFFNVKVGQSWQVWAREQCEDMKTEPTGQASADELDYTI